MRLNVGLRGQRDVEVISQSLVLGIVFIGCAQSQTVATPAPSKRVTMPPMVDAVYGIAQELQRCAQEHDLLRLDQPGSVLAIQLKADIPVGPNDLSLIPRCSFSRRCSHLDGGGWGALQRPPRRCAADALERH